MTLAELEVLSLAGLREALQKQADEKQGMITVSAEVIEGASLTPRADFNGLLNSYLRLTKSLSLKIDVKIPEPTETALEFDGTASFLGLSNIKASLLFTLKGGIVDLRVSTCMGDGWKFSRSFSNMSGYPFDDILMNDAFYVFTTCPQDSFAWVQKAIPLKQGLNFVSSLRMGGPFLILESLLESFSEESMITFVGIINPSNLSDIGKGLPAVSLTGTIDLLVKAIPDYFPLANPRISLEIGKDEENNSSTWLGLVTTISIDKSPLGDFKAGIIKDSNSLSFWFVPTSIVTPETIIKLICGEDFNKAIPTELKEAFNSIGLKSLAFSLNLDTFKISYVSASIGATKPWHMGQFKVDDLVLRYSILNPFSTRSVSTFNFAASSEIFPDMKDIFDGKFVVDITYSISSGALDVGANYIGTVYLSKLVKKLSSNSLDISDLGFDIELKDMGMTFAKVSDKKYDYSLYGGSELTVEMPMLGSKLTADFSARIDSATNSYKIIGGLLIGSSYFRAEADIGKSQKLLKASWNAIDKNYLGVSDIISGLGFSPPEIPEGLDLGLKSASIAYDMTNKILVMEAESANYGKAIFVGRKKPIDLARDAGRPDTGGESNGATDWQLFFGLAVNQSINLTDLPLINSLVSEEDAVAIDKIQVVIATDELNESDAAAINKMIDEARSPEGKGDDVNYPKVPENGMPKGIALSMDFSAGSYHTPLSLTIGSSSCDVSKDDMKKDDIATTALAPVPSDSGGITSTPAPDGTMWYTLQKTFGPVNFQKVGIRYKKSMIYVLMNASLDAGGLNISVLGLGVGSPLTSFKPNFNIDGLAITFTEGPVEISGGMVGTVEPVVNFYGELTLGFPSLTISALGGYSELENHPSFFLYAVLNYPIGGPSFFFITGLAAGFGYNRKLLIPDVSNVKAFPLVQWATGQNNPPDMKHKDGIGEKVKEVLTILSSSGVIAPSIGDYWLALGIKFTSFKLLDSFALLTVSFGTKFEIDLLGLSTLSLPPASSETAVKVEPVAMAELELKASFSPDTGLVAVEGQLTPQSFILSRDCHLIGGFAFYFWFSGPHQGEFVVTLGGVLPALYTTCILSSGAAPGIELEGLPGAYDQG